MGDWTMLSAAIQQRFAARRGFALATINLDHLVKLRADAAFRSAYAGQDLVVADGHPIAWLSKIAGDPVSVLPGSDLVLPLCRLAAAQGVSLALVGSTQAALQDARAYLTAKVPGLHVVLCLSPSQGFDPQSDEADRVLQAVADSGARLCFLALGAPRQERLAFRGRAIVPDVGFASVGAGLDFLGGHQQRAPSWARRFALEWLWRALNNPLRLGPRYLRCIAILPGQVFQALKLRMQ
ncbi:WecB/TagA/CpsF family glycosyltransferase [Rhodobacteraceae bacterium M382]|nr:WecB/TagA/CpsF family glycosyltransferase [Rhodobacteraceae bacterium M382]